MVLGKVIVNGEDGSLQGEGFNGDASFGGAYFDLGQIPSIGDIDGDGQQEVLAGNSIYDAEGNQICSLMDPSWDGFTAIGDLDMDGDGEVVMVWDHKIAIINEHCHVTAEWRMMGEGRADPRPLRTSTATASRRSASPAHSTTASTRPPARSSGRSAPRTSRATPPGQQCSTLKATVGRR